MPDNNLFELPRAGTRVVVDLMGKRYAIDVSIKPLPDAPAPATVVDITAALLEEDRAYLAEWRREMEAGE